METFYFPLATLVLWGFFLIYARPFALQIGMIILTIQVFWVMASLSQTTISLQMMDDIWTRSLRELLISPLTPIEFLTGRILLAITRATLIITVLITASHFILKLKLLDNIIFTSVSVFLTLFAYQLLKCSTAMGYPISKRNCLPLNQEICATPYHFTFSF